MNENIILACWLGAMAFAAFFVWMRFFRHVRNPKPPTFQVGPQLLFRSTLSPSESLERIKKSVAHGSTWTTGLQPHKVVGRFEGNEFLLWANYTRVRDGYSFSGTLTEYEQGTIINGAFLDTTNTRRMVRIAIAVSIICSVIAVLFIIIGWTTGSGVHTEYYMLILVLAAVIGFAKLAQQSDADFNARCQQVILEFLSDTISAQPMG